MYNKKLYNAVVKQACIDYVEAKKRIYLEDKELGDWYEEYGTVPEIILDDCIRFFKGEKFKLLAPELNADVLMDMLDDEVNKQLDAEEINLQGYRLVA